MNDWGGAQWLLAGWLGLSLVVPWLVRIAGVRLTLVPEKSNVDWFAEQLAKWITRGTLIAVLAWGGFW